MKSYALVPDTDPYNADRLRGSPHPAGDRGDAGLGGVQRQGGRGFGVHEAPASKEFPEGTYLVRPGQPKGVAVQMLMEPQPILEDTSFYDLSGWALPLVYNVESYMLSEAPGVGIGLRHLTPARAGGVEGGRGEYAYAIPYNGTSALFAAVELLNQGVT